MTPEQIHMALIAAMREHAERAREEGFETWSSRPYWDGYADGYRQGVQEGKAEVLRGAALPLTRVHGALTDCHEAMIERLEDPDDLLRLVRSLRDARDTDEARAALDALAS